MTERKPAGVSWESWVDQQVREAQERGEFDNLPGTGKPIPGIDEPYDELWWVKQKLRRENVEWLPPTLALRKTRDDALDRASRAPSEAAIREIIADINAKIVECNRMPGSGPPTNMMPVDVEKIVRRWRDERDEAGAADTPS